MRSSALVSMAMGWAKWDDVTTHGTALGRRHATSGSGISIQMLVLSGQVSFAIDDGTASSDNAYAPVTAGRWYFVVGVRRGSSIEIYLDGALAQTTPISAATDTLSETGATLMIGGLPGVTRPHNGALALWRVSASAPSAEQIQYIFETERALFQPGAQCTLYGASDAVTALTHDPVTGLLHVGTSAGRSDFQGLVRVTNTTTAVTTAISAAGGMISEQ